jgi:aspartyl aminopeptidase
VYARHWALAEKACAFLTASTDPYHAVANAITKLEAAGFCRLSLRDAWASAVQPGGKYYYTVHHSTLVAFTVGPQFDAGKSAFLMIGGHTDSPNLRVKPNSKKSPAGGLVQLGVQCYGGGLWHTWLDRDLSISGKVIVRQAKESTDDGNSNNNSNNDNNNDSTPPPASSLEHRLVQWTDPVARVSSLCIHLQTADERAALKLNTEDHTSPIIASTVEASMLESITSQLTSTDGDNTTNAWLQGQEPLLLSRVADQLGVSVNQIADWDLSLYDSQPAQLGGLYKEFLYSGRLDNLATVFCAIEALTQVNNGPAGEGKENPDICVVACFDHEE